MKKWNTPEIAALDLNATESGFFCTEYECWPIVNDNLKKCEQNNDETNNSSTPDESDVTDSLS